MEMNNENTQEDTQESLETAAMACSRAVRAGSFGAADPGGNDAPGAVLRGGLRRWTWLCLVTTALMLWGAVLTLVFMALGDG